MIARRFASIMLSVGVSNDSMMIPSWAFSALMRFFLIRREVFTLTLCFETWVITPIISIYRCIRNIFGVCRGIPYTFADDVLEASHSGLVRTLGKRVCRKAPRVRISPPPQRYHPYRRQHQS